MRVGEWGHLQLFDIKKRRLDTCLSSSPRRRDGNIGNHESLTRDLQGPNLGTYVQYMPLNRLTGERTIVAAPLGIEPFPVNLPSISLYLMARARVRVMAHRVPARLILTGRSKSAVMYYPTQTSIFGTAVLPRPAALPGTVPINLSYLKLSKYVALRPSAQMPTLKHPSVYPATFQHVENYHSAGDRHL